jgi:hypothetical protein
MNENIYYMEDTRITLKEIKPVAEEVGINEIKILLEQCLNTQSYCSTYKGELRR